MWRVKSVLAMALGWLFAIAPAQAAREDVLIVVNDNSIDSPRLGEYYAQRRGVDPTNIAHVRVPNRYFLTWDEFRSLRDQIIRFMQDNTLDDPDLAPVGCSDGEPPYYCPASMEQLRAHTRIRYLVTTRGVPTRMTVDGSTLFAAGAPASVDNYLKYWLVNFFASDIKLQFPEREIAFGDGRGMRAVEPALDRELIVGRIDGLTLDSAKALVDRALAAEADGLYGRFLGSTQFARWTDHSTGSPIYPDWQYQLGLFGESRPECVEYLDLAGGKAPGHCRVRLNEGVDNNNPAPGNPASRVPEAIDALIYQGWLDGQPSIGSFFSLLNWRRNEQCTVTLCRNAPDPAACRAASTDIFQEIDTRCVGVAQGFVGYNHQSWPVSYLAVWPTGWFQSTNDTSWNSVGTGDVNRLAFPEVRTDEGFDDGQSLWFRNIDQISDPRCFQGKDFSFAPSVPCTDSRRVVLTQRIALSPQTLDLGNPQAYRVTLRYRGRGIGAPTRLQVRLFVHETGGGDAQIDYGPQLAMIPAGDRGWTQLEVLFQLDPSLHTAATYDGLKLRIETDIFTGDLGLDAISLQETGSGVELVQNGSFTQGHEQVATGDHAAVFLNRLNGTAFWGSVSHHQSGGCAFCFNELELLVYFLRGLPLGDAVWFNASNNSGILYGDPLYSPVAVRIEPVNDNDTVSGLVNLRGSAINGRDLSRVSTTYSLDFCAGEDFFVCDQDPTAWRPTGIRGQGGMDDMPLGTWDATNIPPGRYTLRLGVTSTSSVTGKTQTFFDYSPLTIQAVDPTQAGRIGFAAGDPDVVESAGGVTVTVTRTGATQGLVSIDYASSDGTATAGEDYGAVSGTLMFEDGIDTQSFTVPIVDDGLLEGDETLDLTLSAPRGGASLGDETSRVITIHDDDLQTPAGASPASASTASTGGGGGGGGCTIGARPDWSLPLLALVSLVYVLAGRRRRPRSSCRSRAPDPVIPTKVGISRARCRR